MVRRDRLGAEAGRIFRALSSRLSERVESHRGRWCRWIAGLRPSFMRDSGVRPAARREAVDMSLGFERRRFLTTTFAVSGSLSGGPAMCFGATAPWRSIVATAKAMLYWACDVVSGMPEKSRAASVKVRISTLSISSASKPCSSFNSRTASMAACAQRQIG